MSIKYEDGSIDDIDDFGQMMSMIKQRALIGKPKPVEITQSGVTVKVAGCEPKKADSKLAEHENFIESKFQKWTIRVWSISDREVYGCNYFHKETVRYLEVPFDNVRDENGVFKYVRSVIEDNES